MTSSTIASRSAFAARKRRTVRVGTRIRTPANGSTRRSNARKTSTSAASTRSRSAATSVPKSASPVTPIVRPVISLKTSTTAPSRQPAAVRAAHAPITPA